jgi:hypothetical protein
MPLQLYVRYPLDRRLGGLQSRSGLYKEEKNITLPGIEPRPSSPSLNRLSFPPTPYKITTSPENYVSSGTYLESRVQYTVCLYAFGSLYKDCFFFIWWGGT